MGAGRFLLLQVLLALLALAAAVVQAQAQAEPRSLFRPTQDDVGQTHFEADAARMLAAGGDAGESSVCHKSGSFLGVGNVDCLHQNLGAAIFLLGIIIVISLLFEHCIEAVRRAIACPQLKKIVNRIFEEVMTLGFISMAIFTLNTSGLLKKIHSAFDGHLSDSERLHFYEFFHYIIFLTMIYFILIVLFLLFVGTVVPKLIWQRQHEASDGESEMDEKDDLEGSDRLDTQPCSRSARGRDDTLMNSFMSTMSEDRLSRREYPSIASGRQLYRPSGIRERSQSGMDLVQGSRAYALLLQRYQHEGWSFTFNVKKQWNLWKSFEILAFNICQHRSGYIYKNPEEMRRLFGIAPKFHANGSAKPMTYDQYHVLCMRNLLFNISHLHFSAFFVLLIIVVIPALYPNYDHWIFLGVGGMLLTVNVVIFLKVLHILRGIVDDRLRVITSADIQRRLARLQKRTNQDNTGSKGKRPSLRAVALAVRAVIRMQMSSLCHHQLHFHNDRFWFDSPRFLLRMFHFATIGQAFYLVWFTLVEWQKVASGPSAYFLIPIMMLLPIIAMCVITPMTMPSLVLVMSLTGIFVELNGNDPNSGHRPTQTETKTHIRLMRRSYLKSHYSDTDDLVSPMAFANSTVRSTDEPQSPSSVFLRVYDSPTAAAQHAKLFESPSPRPRRLGGHTSLPIKKSASGTNLVGSEENEIWRQARTRRSFDLTTYNAASDVAHDIQRTAGWDVPKQWYPPRQVPHAIDTHSEASWTSTPPISPAFKNYCSKYGGYPDM